MDKSLQRTLRQRLEMLADVEYAHFSSALIPHLVRPMLGVRLPLLRKLAKEMAQQHFSEWLDEGLLADTFEEVMLRGMLLGYAPMEWSSRWKSICDFVPLIDNWSVCDSCCATYQIVREHRAEVWPDLLRFAASDKEFEQRFAVVMMMNHFLVDEYGGKVLHVWDLISPKGYYAEMAIGWGLSVAFLKYPDETLMVLEGAELLPACRKKACQKILESRRTPDDLRQRIRDLRNRL